MTNARVLGAVLAGGKSTRYGSPKALATVGGTRIVDRVIAALRSATEDIVLIANDSAVAAAIALPGRQDILEGLGALSGIHAALRWANQEGRRGILAVACDMPFLSPPLLRRLIARGMAKDAPDVVTPVSGGRRGVEPLCSYYSVRCIAAIEAAAAAGDHRIIGFYDRVHVAQLALAEVRAFGEPEVLFQNVNSPEDHELAERLERERSGGRESA